MSVSRKYAKLSLFLGPLLFALFINDICILFGPNIFHILYADDLQIYTRCSPYDLDETAIRLSAVADAILEWAVNNNLQLNLGITEAIVFGSVSYINKLESIARTHIMIGGVAVHFELSVRNLCMILDSKLSWREHVDHVCKKVNLVMYRLNFFKRSTNVNLRTHLVKLLVFPHIDYCSAVMSNISLEQEERLQKLANRGI